VVNCFPPKLNGGEAKTGRDDFTASKSAVRVELVS